MSAPIRRAAPRTLVLSLAASLAPPASVIDPLALAPLFAIAAAAVLAADGRAVLASIRGLREPALLLAALSLWAAMSAAWSILPLHSLLEGLRLGAISAGAVALLAAARAVPEDERRIAGTAAALGLAIALALLLAEAATGAQIARLVLNRPVPLQRYDRAATVTALALWPALVGSAPHPRRWRIMERTVLVIAAAATIFSLDSLGAAIGLAAGLAVFAAAWLAPRVMALAMVTALLGLAVALPLAVPSYEATLALHREAPWIKWSGIHRLFIWRFAADRVAERPLLGWGMDSSRAMPGGKTSIAALFPEAELEPNAELMPLHPHDAILQWEAELGLPGTLIALAFVAGGIGRAGFAPGLSRGLRAATLGWTTAALGIALLDYGAWQAWWLSALALTAAALIAAAAEMPRDSADNPARDRP